MQFSTKVCALVVWSMDAQQMIRKNEKTYPRATYISTTTIPHRKPPVKTVCDLFQPLSVSQLLERCMSSADNYHLLLLKRYVTEVTLVAIA